MIKWWFSICTVEWKIKRPFIRYSRNKSVSEWEHRRSVTSWIVFSAWKLNTIHISNCSQVTEKSDEYFCLHINVYRTNLSVWNREPVRILEESTKQQNWICCSDWLSLFMVGTVKCNLQSTPPSTGLCRIQHLEMNNIKQ
jgi:hypothetical protein